MAAIFAQRLLQLPSCAGLATLLSPWFAALKARDSGSPDCAQCRYRQRCAREAIQVCKSPSCAVRSDLPLCLGPED